jgi:glucose/arabinose dehydrogenase
VAAEQGAFEGKAMKAWLAGLAAAVVVSIGLAQAQTPVPAPPIAAAAIRFGSTCAACHGADAAGGQGPSLVAATLQHGADDESLARSIRQGYPARGMPPFGSTLSEAEIGEMVAYLRVLRAGGTAGVVDKVTAEMPGVQGAAIPAGVVHTDVADFTVEKVAQVGTAFSFAFLPDGRILITEASGALKVVEKGGAIRTIEGTPAPGASPEYFHRRMMGVSLHPDYARNGWIYVMVAAAVQPPPETHNTAVTLHRGRIRGDRWVDDQALFTYETEISTSSVMAWDKDGFLYVGSNDSDFFRQGPPEKAAPQDLTSPVGKILRLTDEGKAPPDNPFVSRPGAYPYIWSYGHRVPAGLAFDRQGRLWETENGPRGGDEVNHIQRGRNYGWPVITWGHIYEDKPELAHPEAPGMEQPVVNFDPSPGMGGLGVYTGKAFPRWADDLFVGSLKFGDLYRIKVDGDREVVREVVLHKMARFRDIATGPDGLLYLLTDSGSLLRLRPAARSK